MSNCINSISDQDGFLCKSKGYFPDQNDCRKFYGCYVVGREAFPYTCPPDKPFYHATKEKCVNITSKDQAASLCPSLLRPTPTTTSSGSLSQSDISPSSPMSIVFSQYTTLLTQVVTTPLSSVPSDGSKRKVLVPTLTTSQDPSSPIPTKISRTLSPTVNPLNWKLCQSVALEKKIKCLRNETENFKDRIHRITSLTMIRDILRATATDAEDVLETLSSQRDNSAAFNAFEVIEMLEDLWKEVQKHLTNNSETIRICTKSFVFESAKVNGLYKFPGGDQVSDYIQLPQKLLSKAKYPCRSVGALYSSLHSMVPVRMSGTNETLKLNSHVISMFLCVPVKETFQGNVVIVMKHLKVLDDNEFTYCAFWDFSIDTARGKGSWSREGCHVVTEQSNSTHTVCACGHLTNFAILMGSAEFSLSKANKFALSVITYVGCVLSLFGAVGAITSFVVFTQLNTDRHIIHGNLLISIAISQTIFLVGIEQTQNKFRCKFTAIMLHYFYLVSFGWMMCEGLHLYTMVVKVFNLSSKIYHYIVLAWGVPALVVLITAASRYSDYGTKTSCWISPERNTLLAFIIPVAGTILANIVILAMVLNEICRLHTSGRTCTGDVVRSTLKSLVVLFPLLGVTWLFGLLVFATHNVVFQYLFALFNTMQGFFIFVLHCLFNSEIRKNFKRKKEAWKSLKAFRYIRKRLSASSVVPTRAPRSSLSEKASTFKASSE
ncbi:hypothetical protein OS493_022765 [Desmophyllum pertusum]|uniref:Uncharacterized protein n=1 Tax=Desmophyllum pertusum TaxID=174260 RepID=A0A9X0CE46_9CNID|nr:hypothetical protein OS493_022765 [Desmophyllum pertusum]